jgi:hypothetical protein
MPGILAIDTTSKTGKDYPKRDYDRDELGGRSAPACELVEEVRFLHEAIFIEYEILFAPLV